MEAPAEVRRIDSGAEFYGKHPEGTAWLVCTKPSSGIERDWVALARHDGTVSEVTDAEFNEITH